MTTVTSIECEEVTAMIQASRCAFEPVPDGIRYEFMNGLRASKPHVYTNKVKALGAARMAYVCKTSTDRVFDWYVGEDGISCGNLGAREFVPIPRLTITPPPPVRPSVVITTTIAPAQPEGSSASAPYFYWPAPAYSGGNTNVRVKNSTRSTSTANATTKGGCTICTPSPKH